jgi:hypothetical protein
MKGGLPVKFDVHLERLRKAAVSGIELTSSDMLDGLSVAAL